jgi:hypothetical protein
MTIRYLSKPDSRGFLERTTGVVTDVVDDLLVVQRTSIFAYHPSNPEGGRFLPIPVPWVFHGKKYDPAVDVIGKNEQMEIL